MKTCLPILFCCGLLAVQGIAQQSALEKLREYRKILPFEKLYLHTDQSVYEPGDMIWFKAYLADDYNHPKHLENSKIQAQLIAPNGQLVCSINLGSSPFQPITGLLIPGQVEGGVYTLRAATQWLFNFGDDAFFEKKILIRKIVLPRLRLKLELDRTQYLHGEKVIARLEAFNNQDQALGKLNIQATLKLGNQTQQNITAQTDQEGKLTLAFELPKDTPKEDGLLLVKLNYEGQEESIARSVPLRHEEIKLFLFPEGGDLVADFQQKIAFKITDTLGNAIDGQGTLYNNLHQPLLYFKSFHKGMGQFSFTPEGDKRYYVCISGQKDTFFLLEPRQDELALQLDLPQQDALSIKVWKRSAGIASLLLRCKDSIRWQQQYPLVPGINKLKISTAAMPIGIAQVILLDEQKRPFAERLVFLHYERQARIGVKSQEKEYLPLDTVNLTLEAKDEKGNPLSGIFSLAVVNDLHWTAADDKQDNILSRFLLSAELRGKIEEPAFYFKPNEPKVPEALDLLMLTHGWRKFTWKEILNIDLKRSAQLLRYPLLSEIRGRVNLGKPKFLPKSKIWLEGQKKFIQPDSTGQFSFLVPTPGYYKSPPTILARCKGVRREYPYPPLLMPAITWPSNKTQFKALPPLTALPQVLPPSDFTTVFKKLEPAAEPNGIFDKQPMALAESVIVSRVPYGVKDLSASIASGHDQDLAAGIGDNLYIGMRNNYGFYFELELEQEPGFKEENQRQVLYTRLFASFPQNPDHLYEALRHHTIYWNPDVHIIDGKGRVSFRHTTKTGTYRMVVEGLSQQALPGRAEGTYAVQKPIELSARAPEMVLSGDTLILEAWVKNRSQSAIKGALNISTLSDALQLLEQKQVYQEISVAANSIVSTKIPFLVQNLKGEFPLELHWQNGPQVEKWQQKLQVHQAGFQYDIAQASQQRQHTYQLVLPQFIPKSLSASFSAYPMIYQEMVEGLSSIVREPHGCFEQVSSSNYPSILALQILNEMGGVDFDFQRKAFQHLQKAYHLLTSYEVPGGGFSIFGKAPASERLTAYGLLQFWDMRSVYPQVEMTMFERNLKWLLKRKNLNGEYSSDLLSHLFTLYVLSEIRPEEAVKDLESFEQKYLSQISEDPYLIAILLCAYANVGWKEETLRLRQYLQGLLQVQKPGKFKVESTFGLSYGKNVQTETAAWTVLALCKAGLANATEVQNLLDFLRSTRQSSGGFGSTQATVMTLKALQAYKQRSGYKDQSSGKIALRVNQNWIDTLEFKPKQLSKLHLDFSEYLKTGKNEIEVVQFAAGDSIPYLLQSSWASLELPKAELSGNLKLKTHYTQQHLAQGDFVRLNIQLSNPSARNVNAPMAWIGLPAGLSLQNWQLLDLEQKKRFDHFELKDNYLIVYLESLGAGAEHSFYLDLKAEFPGYYQTPASLCYPYYDAEQKVWVPGTPLFISTAKN